MGQIANQMAVEAFCKMKKKNRAVLAGVVVCFALILVFVLSGRMGKRPFKDLQTSDIQSAAVTLGPPDQTIQIAGTDELTEYLRDLVIYQEDNSYMEYAGQTVIFNLIMADGTEKSITAFYPFLIIDGIGYRTKYEPCEALAAYASQLRE